MRKRLAHAALLIGLAWAVSACNTEGLTEVNENPNAPTDVAAGLLFARSIQLGVQQTFGGAQFQSHTAIWPGHWVELQYPDEEQGQVRPARMDAYWSNYYAGALMDVQTVIDKGLESSTANIEAVGRIWKAWLFHQVTDLWGDVPYSEALQAADNSTPAYDTQSSIYAGILAELTAAQAMLSPGADGFDEGDLIYDGDYEAWRRFANSLRMRLAMRLSEVDATTAQAEFVAAYNAGGFQSSADDAWLQWASAPYENPIYENSLVRDDHGVSATMIDTLKSLNDPRLELYAEPAESDGEYRGHENGHDDLPVGQSLAWFSRPGNHWRFDGAATPTAIMTYSELLFLEAEAAERGWIAGSAATLYTEAITENMALYADAPNAPTAAEITAYLAQPEVAYAGLTSIYIQKWIGLWMNGCEAWAEWRRTDVPDLVEGPDLLISRIPVRFSYPDTEQSLNAANLDAAVTRQGGGLDLVTLVWWDVQ